MEYLSVNCVQWLDTTNTRSHQCRQDIYISQAPSFHTTPIISTSPLNSNHTSSTIPTTSTRHPHPQHTPTSNQTTHEMTTPDALLTLAHSLAQLATNLADASAKLAAAATQLEHEAANLAEERARQWGFDVQVAVGVRGRPGAIGGAGGNVIEIKQ
ncbi:hypothetical protein P153DRAFT_400093 [Dothidotthia symphoricarpi CBS 119687]|uniref:Uncharacterized protein n=1 Tax=Dothidotthia symphoricarpi CBS 119687 TaxID=1392245 RepID=A0A6A6A3U7_9PLEO|nr:uncharacterized protein P153DRAFT_400093 [Dothidotthia symphoricarpi CBS 119687]KAF2125261.1 hypothetical protein P153DRAFT_400093 [Dothidotthia symphoricarpi CBS 119687]